MNDNEEKVIVDEKALNAPSDTVDEGPVDVDPDDGIELADTDLIPPAEPVRLPGCEGHERPVGSTARPPGVRLPSEPTDEPASADTTPVADEPIEPPSSGGKSVWWHNVVSTTIVGLTVLIALLLLRQCDGTDHRLANLERLAVTAQKSADSAVNATTALSGKVEGLTTAVGELGERVNEANKLAAETAETLVRFSVELVGNPDDPSGKPGLLNQLLDSVEGVRKAQGRNSRALKEFREEFKERDAQFASINARLGALSQKTADTFTEAKGAREATERPVNVKVLIPRTKTVVVDRK